MGNTDYSGYVHSEKSIRQIVFDLMADNKDISPSQICFILHQSYGFDFVNKQTVKNYMVDWRNRNYYTARPLRPHRRVFRWFVERAEEREKSALSREWCVAGNRNRMFVWKGDFGSVHWYLSGTVLVNLRGEALLARAKETFSRAFSFLPKEELVRLLDAPSREIGRQWVFDLGQPLPRFEIRHFEKSHGLRIYSDGSHPTSIEVSEAEPFWLHRMDEMSETMKLSTVAFTESMNEHLGIIKTFREESDARSNEVSLLLKDLRRFFRRRRQTRKPKKKPRFWDRFKLRRREKKREEPLW